MKVLTKNAIKLLTILSAVALALCLMGCSSSDSSKSGSSEAEQTQVEKDFDGTNATDTGEGVMYISTAGGTSEDGNVPEITGGGLMQIGVDTVDMDGSVCTIYVDGMENDKINAGERTQNTITIEGDAVKPGEHTVELVKLDDTGEPVIYKVAQYKVVE